ncbi:hypothetical protein AAC387_Pa02g3757 [Persea americana]
MTSISCLESVVQQIISTHSPDANFNVDEKALLRMANDILCKAISKLSQDLKKDLKVSKDDSDQQVITEELAFTIRRIGCELSCNCSGGGGIVACSSQSIALVNLQYMVSNTEAQKKLTELTQKLETIHEDLRHTLTVFNKEREEKKNKEGYIKIQNLIESSSTHKTNNVKIFTELIQTEDDKPLFNGLTKKRESLKAIKCKTVILFISNLDILDEEINEIAERVSTPLPMTNNGSKKEN